jgi:hypothetical protein
VVRLRLLALLAPLVLAAPLLSACEDNSFLVDVLLSTDTVTVGLPGSEMASALDLARATLGAPLLRRPETLRDAQEWDVTLRRTGTAFSLRSNQAIATGVRGAGISPTSSSFETVERAPRETSSYETDPVALSVGATYFIRSRQFSAGLGVCQKFAKMKVLALDQAAGTAQLALVVNENCDDERLTDD